jgi:hypothetical protein
LEAVVDEEEVLFLEVEVLAAEVVLVEAGAAGVVVALVVVSAFGFPPAAMM